MTCGSALMRTMRPTAAGSAPKRDCQMACVSTTACSVAIGEHAAETRAPAERREERRGHPGRTDLLGRTGERQGCGAWRDQRGILDRRRLAAAVEIVRNGDLRMVAVLPGVPHEHQPLGLTVGQRPQQDVVEDGEDGGIRPGRDRQRQHGRNGKGRPVAKSAKRVAQIVHARLDGLRGGEGLNLRRFCDPRWNFRLQPEGGVKRSMRRSTATAFRLKPEADITSDKGAGAHQSFSAPDPKPPPGHARCRAPERACRGPAARGRAASRAQPVAPVGQDLVERRDHEQRQQRRRDHAADHRAAERRAEVGALAGADARPASCRRSARTSSSGSAAAGRARPRSAPRAAPCRSPPPTWRSRSAGSRSSPRCPSAGSRRSGS